ncbi:hypothetical protein M413DRAFT_442345 [Hebeloma cylindrosporum]|uniref:MYND-type domain-containing protein n=1 Tax=Hebeloma cylindrosporum TaxID=76867 RepID=A0A0C2Y7A8_HEBCY|nr:hypothetical protein M413DRAFT_442345 [Hebeloma cylindrosporum h7]
MHGVIRFLDTDLLPASSPEDYPKIIKSGIDEEGQHDKSPNITGPDGIATLLHRVGRPQLLERLLDVGGTQEYDLRVRTGEKYLSDVYVTRRGARVEIGFINSEGEWAQHGVRYRISPEPEGSPYRIGKWIPISTSDMGCGWGGSDVWVRAQGAAIAKGIWFHKLFNRDIEVSWSGMSEDDKVALTAWLKERSEGLAEQRKIGNEEYKARKAKYGDNHDIAEMKMAMQAYYKLRMACRAECGEQNPKSYCSKCKVARYCSTACQSEDWKYHKTYCGTEEPIPKEQLDPRWLEEPL